MLNSHQKPPVSVQKKKIVVHYSNVMISISMFETHMCWIPKSNSRLNYRVLRTEVFDTNDTYTYCKEKLVYDRSLKIIIVQ